MNYETSVRRSQFWGELNDSRAERAYIPHLLIPTA
jgi:hypothetical protein